MTSGLPLIDPGPVGGAIPAAPVPADPLPPAARRALPLLAVIGAGAALRLVLAYLVFPGQGLSSDLGLFEEWASTLARVGPGSFYAASPSANYPPAYLYVLWLIGAVGAPLGSVLGTSSSHAVLLLLKVPAMAADIGIAVLLYRAAGRWFGGRAGLLAAALYLFVPVTWYDSALWGQVDAVGTLVMLAAVLLLIDGWSEPAVALAAFSVLVKPQDAIVLVVVIPVLVRRHLLRAGSGPVPVLGPRLAALDRRLGGMLLEQGPVRLGTSAVVAGLALILPIVPFDIARFGPAALADVPVLGQLGGLAGLYASAGGEFAVLTANAYNAWALVGANPLAAAIGTQGGSWTPDSLVVLGGVPAVMVASGLLILVGLMVAGGLLLRDDRLAIVLGFALVAFAFYALPTRVHERYLFPFFAAAALLVSGAAARALAYGIVGVANAINIHAVLAAPLSIGASLRSGGGDGSASGFAGRAGAQGTAGIPPGIGGPGAGGVTGAFGGTGGGHAVASIHLPLADLARSEPVVIAVALGQTLALGVLVVAWAAVVLQPVLDRRFTGASERGRRAGATGSAASGATDGGR